MSRIHGILLLSAALLLSVDRVSGDETAEKSAEKNFVEIKTEESAPSYDKIVPIAGWTRSSGDSARSASGWVRWWKYLRMKKPVVMKWMDGLVLRIYPGNEICRALFVRGIYDPNLMTVTDKLLSKDAVMIEAGANMGYISLPAAKIVGPKGRIIASEPCSRDFQRLEDNVNLNNLANIISIHKTAVSDKIGKAQLIIACEERSALNTLGSEIASRGVEKAGSEEVDTVTVDRLAEKERINRLDVLKLDIEGSELKALLGAKDTIEKYRPALILGVKRDALKSCNADRPELQNVIKEMRYFAYKISEEPIFALEKIENISDIEGDIIICLHESIVPPVLPQPKKNSLTEAISEFFLR
ncbi:MAG: FkbM family methyltransferase [Holosporaceae bacterium]|jgi:FkbM family methyltransferase|nr:FkbM family methyltransferase [Holosporaceae bacterium]